MDSNQFVKQSKPHCRGVAHALCHFFHYLREAAKELQRQTVTLKRTEKSKVRKEACHRTPVLAMMITEIRAGIDICRA